MMEVEVFAIGSPRLRIGAQLFLKTMKVLYCKASLKKIL